MEFKELQNDDFFYTKFNADKIFQKVILQARTKGT